MMDSVTEYELIFVIVNFGQGSKVLKKAKKNGVSEGTVFLGMGTVKNRVLEFLELADIRKEIVVLVSEKELTESVIGCIDEEFDLSKPYHGIAFTVPLPGCIGYGRKNYIHNMQGGVGKAMYHSIIAIVERGKADLVMDAATKAGARGGTVVKARGSGPRETDTLFHMAVESEREIVMILSEATKTETIMDSIWESIKDDVKSNNVIYCLNVNQTYGVS